MSQAFISRYITNQKQPSCNKTCGPQKSHGDEIQGGGQEMDVIGSLMGKGHGEKKM